MLRELGDVSNRKVGCPGNKELRVGGLAGKWDAEGTGEMQVSRGPEGWDAQGTGAVGTRGRGEMGWSGYRGDAGIGGSGEMGWSGKRGPWSGEKRSRVSGEPRELCCRETEGTPGAGVPRVSPSLPGSLGSAPAALRSGMPGVPPGGRWGRRALQLRGADSSV